MQNRLVIKRCFQKQAEVLNKLQNRLFQSIWTTPRRSLQDVAIALVLTDWIVHKTMPDGSPSEIDHFAVLAIHQKQVVERLAFVLFCKVSRHLEFINSPGIHDQIHAILFIEAAMSDVDHDFDPSACKSRSQNASREIVLIDLLVTTATQNPVRLKRKIHDLEVQLLKRLL